MGPAYRDEKDSPMNSGGRVIAVGDPNQAIYGFRGAMSHSMQ